MIIQSYCLILCSRVLQLSCIHSERARYDKEVGLLFNFGTVGSLHPDQRYLACTALRLSVIDLSGICLIARRKGLLSWFSMLR